MLNHYINCSAPPDQLVKQGSRLTYMFLVKNKLRFIDSLSFFQCSLAKLSKTFNIETVKGYFPHYFNTKENQNYIGDIPDYDYFGAGNMTKEGKQAFH